MKTKTQILDEKIKAAEALTAKMDADEAERTEDNQKAFDDLCEEVKSLQAEIVKENGLKEAKSLLEEPAHEAKSRGAFIQPAQVRSRAQSLGEAFVETEAFKNAAKAWSESGRTRTSVALEMKDALITPSGIKATADTASMGQETYINYQGNGGMPVLIEQQRLTIRNLLAQGQTTMNAVPYLREVSYTNAATSVAEEGLKPEASFVLEDVTAPVKKIAVTAKVSDEMWADFPSMRSYIDNRLRFMRAEREEALLLNGDGVGSNITGILQSSPQTQAFASSTPTNSDRAMAVHNAITKIRVIGKFEPDGMVVHPNDWEQIRLAQDENKQYYGGGPFTGAYGNGGIAVDRFWNLPVVITTAISEGTALVGAFKLGAQIFDRTGVSVDMTNVNEDDFVTNRMTIRVENRLALAVYRPLAFCTVTGI